MNLGAAPFTFVAIIIVGYVFRIIPVFPNKWIPAVCVIVGPVIFTLLNPHATSISDKVFYIHSIVGGLFIGISAWLVHDKFISAWEDRLKAVMPGADAVLTDTLSNGHKTSFLTKSQAAQPPEPPAQKP